MYINHLSPSNNNMRLFFCGIGGVSMLSLAVLCSRLGYFVGGSDYAPSQKAIDVCRQYHIPLYFSHDESNIAGYDVFIYTAAIKRDNPEYKKAHMLGLNMISRATLLGKITDEFESSIAVSGTHGKSTVTAMIYSIFKACSRSPYLLCGARLVKADSAYAIGEESTVIYEACEYNRSFLEFNPKTAVVLNIEREHTDVYSTLLDSENAFFDFSSRAKNVILSADCKTCLSLGSRLKNQGVKTSYFSLHRAPNALFAENLYEKNGFFTFDTVYENNRISDVKLQTPGLHNVKNALASALTCLEYGIPPEFIKLGLEKYMGIKRRFEYIGSYNGAEIYDDYAHHPTEIRASLECAKKMGYNKIICVFQPHTYSRTHDLFDEFISSFENCDEVIFADIYAAREKNVYGITSKKLASATKNGKYLGGNTKILEYLRASSNPKTLILTMGAGEMDKIAIELSNENKVNF